MSERVPPLPDCVCAAYRLGGYGACVPLLRDVPEGVYACPEQPCGADCPQCYGRGAVRVRAAGPDRVHTLWSV